MLCDFEKNNAVLDVFSEIEKNCAYIFFVRVSFRKRLSTHSSSGVITKRMNSSRNIREKALHGGHGINGTVTCVNIVKILNID